MTIEEKVAWQKGFITGFKFGRGIYAGAAKPAPPAPDDEMEEILMELGFEKGVYVPRPEYEYHLLVYPNTGSGYIHHYYHTSQLSIYYTIRNNFHMFNVPPSIYVDLYNPSSKTFYETTQSHKRWFTQRLFISDTNSEPKSNLLNYSYMEFYYASHPIIIIPEPNWPYRTLEDLGYNNGDAFFNAGNAFKTGVSLFRSP